MIKYHHTLIFTIKLEQYYNKYNLYIKSITGNIFLYEKLWFILDKY